jgi:threonine/homoserine/homoserine lactone efflux protein
MTADLLLIGLGITLEPFPLIAFILLLSAGKGIWKGAAFILGWLACLAVVIIAVEVVTGGKPVASNTAPSTAVLAVKLAAGIVLILLGIRQWRRTGQPRKPPSWLARLDRLSPWAAAGLAAFLQPWTLVAAGAATITAAQLSSVATYLTLVFFCLLATSSFLVMEGYTLIAPAAAEIRLRGLRTWLDTHRDQIIIAICVLLGCWLVAKSSYYLLS